MKKIIIAIDGPAGSGKTTTALGIAKKLNILHLDTGAMYRAVTYFAIKDNITPFDINKLDALSHKLDFDFIGNDNNNQLIIVNKNDITKEIRSSQVTSNVSKYSKIKCVRDNLVAKQRKIAKNRSLVAEGRDIGTVVFPDADYKFFLNATIQERAKRRYKEIKDKKVYKVEFDDILKEIKNRDKLDSERDISPLKKADDAVVIDTTGLTINGQINKIIENIKIK